MKGSMAGAGERRSHAESWQKQWEVFLRAVLARAR